jgi:hypothetical protein
MTQAETVTLFNDMCIMAPGTLIDPAIAWEAVDARTARATITNQGHSIRAELSFNDAGELTNFWPDDRRRISTAGNVMTSVRRSTSPGHYRAFGSVRFASGGESRWHEPGRRSTRTSNSKSMTCTTTCRSADPEGRNGAYDNARNAPPP